MVFSEQHGNILGLDYLSRYVVTCDFPHMKMYLKPGKRFAEPGNYNLSGALVSRRDRKTRISRLRPGSAAERAGLRIGDTIDKIDGRPAESFSLQQIHKLICVPGVYHLRVLRDAKSLDVTLTLSLPAEHFTAASPQNERLRTGIGKQPK